MKLEYECGCSVQADSDGYGGIDATYLKLCDNHKEVYDGKKQTNSQGKD